VIRPYCAAPPQNSSSMSPYRLLKEVPAKLAVNTAFAKQTVSGDLGCFRFGLFP
jgi:hypothetical protein